MRIELIVSLWIIFATSIIYWDMHRYDISEITLLLSDCHNVEIKMLDNKPLCTKCKKYCEVKNEL